MREESAMLEGFDFHMPRWHPFQDQAACERVRAIKKEEITRSPSPHLRIEIVPDDQVAFQLAMDMFWRIKTAADEGRRIVFILPQPEPLYAWLAFLVNRFRINCRHLYTFNMDEYADEDGNIAPETWPNAFHYSMKNNFYAKVDPELRPPESQIVGPTNGNLAHYGRMIEDVGGADVCYGAIGWSGHLAYIEPGSEAFAPRPMEEWIKLGPAIVELTPFSILQNSLDPEWGRSGDWSWMCPKAATIGPAQIMGARLRSSWNAFRVGNSYVSWQRFTVRMAAHGPITPLIPATMLQMAPSELYISDTVAGNIEAESVLNFNYYI
jgi:glucosamine-6-phosphate deaminase